jgi:hypothetical protein
LVDQRVHVASEIGDIERFASPAKLCGYTGLCPRVIQSGNADRRGPISKHGPRYLRWGLFEASMNACKQPLLRRALPAHQAPVGPPARPQGRPIELSRQARRGDLAHAHPQSALRAGRRPVSSSGLTALNAIAPPERTSHFA